MPDKYYYLVAFLPYLAFDDPMPIKEADFLSECSKWLSPDDFETLTSMKPGDFGPGRKDPRVIGGWKAFELSFREELAAVRKMRQSLPGERIPSEFRAVFEQPTPLLMEREIEKRKWRFLEGLEIDHHFDLEAIIIYYLKLRVLARLEIFNDEEKGKHIFTNLCEVKHE
ncbi:MAG: DUF2764 family protein [Candidatus Omnitrophota bacterium]